jgi:hypothetical protein
MDNGVAPLSLKDVSAAILAGQASGDPWAESAIAEVVEADFRRRARSEGRRVEINWKPARGWE